MTDLPIAIPNDRKKRILVVDDHPMFRRGLIHSINAEPDLCVCGEVDASDKVLEAITRLNPDLVALDVSLPGKSGLELLPEILAARPETRVLILSMHEEFLYAERALRLGAGGYIMKHEDPSVLMKCIRQVLSGGIYLSAGASNAILQKVAGRGASGSKFAVEQLSEREFEVFQMLGKGLTTTEIGEKLQINVRTVVVHCSNIRRKLNVKTGSELTACAVRYFHS